MSLTIRMRRALAAFRVDPKVDVFTVTVPKSHQVVIETRGGGGGGSGKPNSGFVPGVGGNYAEGVTHISVTKKP
jgi:hypothetical protein